ncbi:MAG: DMT family transporter [Phycisphaeraceae bacterium]|nr:DMT family transporter [Phycisphaeraceae bacterium]
MKGVLLALGAGLCWGVGELCTKSVLHTHKVGPITAITVRSTVALPVLWLAYAIAVHWLEAEPREWMRAGAPTILKLVLGSGLVAGAAAMVLFYAALHVGEISRIKPIAFATAPAVAVVLGWLVLRESMTLAKAIGVLLILSGVVVLTGGGRPTAQSPASDHAERGHS